jgi:hypothetical protein
LVWNREIGSKAWFFWLKNRAGSVTDSGNVRLALWPALEFGGLDRITGCGASQPPAAGRPPQAPSGFAVPVPKRPATATRHELKLRAYHYPLFSGNLKMKRTVEQARSLSAPQGVWQTSHPYATPGHPDGNAPLRTFTADEFRNMPRPPGDYSGMDTDSCLNAAIFFKDGEVPETESNQQEIYLFCIENKLADALSYLCVRHNLHELKIDHQLNRFEHISFICDWAQTISFEMALNFNFSGWPDGHLPLLRVFENSAITRLTFDFCWRSAAFQCEVLKTARNNSTLKKLEVINMHNDAIEELLDVLACNSTIIHLDLDIGGIKDETAIRLCSLIEQSTSVTSLAIRMHQAEHYLPLFCKMLGENACLESFAVDRADWDEDEARALSASLKRNQHLRVLRIKTGENDTLTAAAARILLDALKSNNRLTSLALESLNANDEIAKDLGELIRTNTTLQSLRLHGPGLEKSSAMEIADALPSNTCLRTLDLYGGFTEIGFSQIINSCSSMPALSNLYLIACADRSFPFSSDDIALLIRSNKTLESIGLCVLSPRAGLLKLEGLDAVSAAVQSNHTLGDFGLLLTNDWSKWKRMQEIFSGAKNFPLDAQGQQYGPYHEDIVSKVRANAEARRLRAGTVLALGMLAPDIPDQVLEVIADQLTFRNEEQPEKSGTAAMRDLAKIVGLD